MSYPNYGDGGAQPQQGGEEQGGFEQGGFEQGGFDQGGYGAPGAPQQQHSMGQQMDPSQQQNQFQGGPQSGGNGPGPQSGSGEKTTLWYVKKKWITQSN